MNATNAICQRCDRPRSHPDHFVTKTDWLCVFVPADTCLQCDQPTTERFCNACVGAEMAKIQSEESN